MVLMSCTHCTGCRESSEDDSSPSARRLGRRFVPVAGGFRIRKGRLGRANLNFPEEHLQLIPCRYHRPSSAVLALSPQCPAHIPCGSRLPPQGAHLSRVWIRAHPRDAHVPSRLRRRLRRRRPRSTLGSIQHTVLLDIATAMKKVQTASHLLSAPRTRRPTLCTKLLRSYYDYSYGYREPRAFSLPDCEYCLYTLFAYCWCAAVPRLVERVAGRAAEHCGRKAYPIIQIPLLNSRIALRMPPSCDMSSPCGPTVTVRPA